MVSFLLDKELTFFEQSLDFITVFVIIIMDNECTYYSQRVAFHNSCKCMIVLVVVDVRKDNTY